MTQWVPHAWDETCAAVDCTNVFQKGGLLLYPDGSFRPTIRGYDEYFFDMEKAFLPDDAIPDPPTAGPSPLPTPKRLKQATLPVTFRRQA